MNQYSTNTNELKIKQETMDTSNAHVTTFPTKVEITEEPKKVKKSKKKSKGKKSKKKSSYKDFMKSMMGPRKTDKQVQSDHQEKLMKNLGGGAFSKIDKI